MSGGAVVNMKGELVGLTTTAANAAGLRRHGRLRDPDGRASAAGSSRRSRQGKEIEYGLLGIRLDTGRHQPGRGSSARAPRPAQGESRSTTRSSPSATSRSPTSTRLILAINTMPAGDEVTLKIRRAGQELIERTVELAKFRVDGEVIATNRPAAWRGLRVDYTSTLTPPRPSATPIPRADGPRRGGRHRGRGGLARRRAGLKTGQVIRQVDGKTRAQPPRVRQGRRRARRGPSRSRPTRARSRSK